MFSVAYAWHPEGSLDVKYLSTRYERGVSKVASFMADRQRYCHMPSLLNALPDFLQVTSGFAMDEVFFERN